MYVKIDNVEFSNKTDGGQYVVTSYGRGSIGIRARVQAGKDLENDEAKLYSLREGRTAQVEILTDGGSTIKGTYKINELNWKKEKKKDDDQSYELVFNIGLQEQ
jgi:hypothetical protein